MQNFFLVIVKLIINMLQDSVGHQQLGDDFVVT